jgi:hypothetical protein
MGKSGGEFASGGVTLAFTTAFGETLATAHRWEPRRLTHTDSLVRRNILDRQKFLDAGSENGGSESLIEDSVLSANFVHSVLVDLHKHF